MALKKITELQTVEELKRTEAHVVATQPEVPEGAEDPIESARRVPIAVLAEAISQILRLGENEQADGNVPGHGQERGAGS